MKTSFVDRNEWLSLSLIEDARVDDAGLNLMKHL